MADQAVDKVDATAPAVEAPSASGDNVGTEPTEATPKVDTKPDDGDAGKEDKVTEGEDQFLFMGLWESEDRACPMLAHHSRASQSTTPALFHDRTRH